MTMKNLQSGRSMVEMLGTLAIVGVLSVGGIAGYSYGMDKYRANEIINNVMLRAVDLVRQVAQGGDLSLSEWPSTLSVGYDIGLEIDTETNTTEGGIYVLKVPQRICEMVAEDLLPDGVALTIDGTDYVSGKCGQTNKMVFYYDAVTGMTEDAPQTPDVIISATSPQNFKENLYAGMTYYLQIQASSEPEADLSYSLNNAPDGMSIDSNGLITFSPVEDVTATDTATVVISAMNAEAVSVDVNYSVAQTTGDCSTLTYCDIIETGSMTVNLIMGGIKECGVGNYCKYAGALSNVTVNGCSVKSFYGPVSGTCTPVNGRVTEKGGLGKEELLISFMSECYASGGRLPTQDELGDLLPSETWYVSGNQIMSDTKNKGLDVLTMCVPFAMTGAQMQESELPHIIKCIYDE